MKGFLRTIRCKAYEGIYIVKGIKEEVRVKLGLQALQLYLPTFRIKLQLPGMDIFLLLSETDGITKSYGKNHHNTIADRESGIAGNVTP